MPFLQLQTIKSDITKKLNLQYTYIFFLRVHFICPTTVGVGVYGNNVMARA